LVDHFEGFRGRIHDDENRDMAFDYFEGYLNLFVEYEKGIQAYGELSRRQKEL
jgi:hypothetical protein